ncbi:hypothetical protein Lalb_Chr04g0256371 [Lupinus albus]|uniref:Uncharacterized protein n=1 Tax=Lupinus albus TaxID=3870 RepID=A0A6A4QNP4_LUPAL|nr:hypothetical protein Lalb_Chr04g0256371 [Lupinus albus]
MTNIPNILMINTIVSREQNDIFYESLEEEVVLAPKKNTSSKPIGGPWSTFDDLPSNKWWERFFDLGAWLDNKMMSIDTNSYKGIEEFYCKMTITMKEWYHNLEHVYWCIL